MPEDQDGGVQGTGRQRDVYQLGMIAREILEATAKGGNEPVLEPWLADWLDSATSANPAARFASARTMADALSEGRAAAKSRGFDHSRLDVFETKVIPYAVWPRDEEISSGFADIYLSKSETAGDLVVKVWPGVRRNVSLQLDFALLRLLEGARRLTTSPLEGFPRFERLACTPWAPTLFIALFAASRSSN
jgi:hypothetical protein